MRTSGILMHISSLPSPGGIGSLGPEAYAFADFLQASGMRIWQVLPVGPTGYGESPYQSSSVFAGNPLLISCVRLREEGLLTYTDEEEYRPDDPEKVNYDAVRSNKETLLRRCYAQSRESLTGQIDEFVRDNAWVNDFALFTALKQRFGGVMWTKWPDADIRFRKPEAVRKYKEELSKEIDYHIFCQYLFRRQWFSLKKYCNERSLLLFGDMPIYVAEDSADTWTHPEIFQLDKNLIPKRVAGVPPDYFCEDGQLWGNPLYRWTYLRFCRKYDWWVERMKGMSLLYDMVRIDHFIGFANYYSVKYGMPNARKGKWVVGPGKSLFRRLELEVSGIRIIAEDLGCVNDRVMRLLQWCGYPGMKVLTFGFDSDESNPHFIGHYEKNCVAYTGTHDNDTTLGWAEKADPKALAFAEKTLGFSGAKEAPEAFIRALFKSPCDTVIIPMQDILGLGGSARMNYPGSTGGNWLWRMKPDQLSLELSMKYYRLNRQTERG
ncbi:MAG: 4-alpha-glucanotransferase [Clostridia bacterium]|nr:4-alpha-glucanotransferase [Clostridia bacterium]